MTAKEVVALQAMLDSVYEAVDAIEAFVLRESTPAKPKPKKTKGKK
jgi:hypothetical protein